MKNIKFIIRYILFWLFFFLTGRVIFILFFSREVSESSFFEILKIIPRSFSLDISFISYLLVIIVLLMWVFSFFKKGNKVLSKIIFGITSFFIIFSSLVNGGEIALYSEWQTKLNYTALSHFINPKEVFSTASFSHIFTMILFICVSVIFIRIYKRKVHLFLSFFLNFSIKNFLELRNWNDSPPLLGEKNAHLSLFPSYFRSIIIGNKRRVSTNTNKFE